ncbi:hypothetical protein [Gluconobacter wancherniae]|uniref:hypothetical protein n=1 Tax=Gluconobacter wancherniae TaxID=1307955 RepID=UPI0011BE7222|nr:hypothetical protein [Gluconobacter wancherniae]MBF0854716.1 hypothetical protein [Gluconobacter wancherniae]MBS1063567.1 hypothetical protein [Gluconobacter wancherniae]MBS1089394.1 hypothetical protein [Gluconobacter wancherniae]MBS1095138.1 hypothetical protein [Gluconobacter wancherniae]GBD57785.1 hypothetical protein NBRC103581_02381 [Gluconobacter wancherniae NBRC 103581]
MNDLKKLLPFAAMLLLAGCASHQQSDMNEDSGNGEYASNDSSGEPGGGRGHGGGNSIWSDVFRTALQTGMGFVHH